MPIFFPGLKSLSCTALSGSLFLHAEDIGMRACVDQRQCENIILNDSKLTIHFYAIINPALQTKNDFQSSIHERE